jgi:MFS family permease
MDKFLQNVGAAYNLSVVSLVLVALKARKTNGGTDTPNSVSPEDLAWVGSSGMLGAVTGQLLLGILGDMLGRQRSLLLTTLLLTVGSILSAT